PMSESRPAEHEEASSLSQSAQRRAFIAAFNWRPPAKQSVLDTTAADNTSSSIATDSSPTTIVAASPDNSNAPLPPHPSPHSCVTSRESTPPSAPELAITAATNSDK